MSSSTRIQPAIIKGAQEVNSIWVITLFRYKGVSYQAHMSLFLVLFWLAYDFYTKGLSLYSMAINLIGILSILSIYELVRVLSVKITGMTFNQVTLYPFAGVSSIDRQQLTNMIDNFVRKTKKSECSIKSAQNIEKTVKLQCLPAVVLLLIAACMFSLNLAAIHSAFYVSFVACLVISISALLPVTPFPGACLMAIINRNWWSSGVNLTDTLPKLLLLLALTLLTVSSDSITLTIIAITYTTVIIEQHMFEKTKSLAANTNIFSAMIPENKLVKLRHGQTLEQSLEAISNSFQTVFPVLHAEQLVGFVQRNHLVRSVARMQDDILTELTDRDFAALDVSANLGDALGVMHTTGKDYIAVCKDPLAKEFVGLLTKDKLLETILIKSATNFDPWLDNEDN